MKKVIIIFIVLCLSVVLFMAFKGCKSEPKTVYKSDYIEIISNGKNTTVYDIQSNKEYKYTIKRVRRSESNSAGYTSVDTDTVKIDILPDAGLSVYDKKADRTFLIKHKRGI